MKMMMLLLPMIRSSIYLILMVLVRINFDEHQDDEKENLAVNDKQID